MSSRDAVVLLASGGLDSTTLFYQLATAGHHAVPVFIDYGQHCAATELATLREVLPRDVQPRVINVSDVYRGTSSRLIEEADLWNETVDYEDLFLPYRSLLLLSTGCAYAQARGMRAVYAAFINSNHAQEIDCSADFFRALSALLAGYGSVELRLPFRDLSKSDVVRLAIQLNVPIGKTYSCQVSGTVACGACPNCVDRLDALEMVAMDVMA